MNIVKLLIVVGLVGYGAHAWKTHSNKAALAAMRSESGFLPVAMPDGARKNAVVILAPQNCPKEGARRADDLAEQLGRRGIAVVRSDSYNTSVTDPTAEQRASVERAVAVLKGEVPAVFVNGMGKSNPTVDEVAAEYHRTK